MPDSISGSSAARGDRVRVVRRRRRGAASTRSSRGTSRRCRGSADPAGRRPRARCSTCPIRRCRRWRRRYRPGAGGSAAHEPRAYRWVDPAPGFERRQQVLGALLVDEQLDQADRAARVVVDVHVLDVDPAVAGVGEQPGQLAGVVGHRDEDRAPSAGAVRRACRGSPGCRPRPRSSSACSAAAVAVADRARSASSSRPRTSASRSSTASALAATICAVERRVPGGHPGHVADALAGQRQVVARGVGEPAGDQRRRAGAARARCGPPPGRAPRGSAAPARRRTAAPAPRPASTASGSDVSCGVTAHGRPSKSAALRGQRPGALAAGHRVPADVAARRPGCPATAASGPDFTLPTSVTTASVRAQRRGDHVAPRWSGGTATTTSCGRSVRCAAGRHPARTRCAGARASASLSSTSSPARRQASADRGAEQPGADHLDRAGERHSRVIVGHRADPGQVAAQRRRRRAGRRG